VESPVLKGTWTKVSPDDIKEHFWDEEVKINKQGITAKWVKIITVIDPDTKNSVGLSIFKHQNGGMFGIDSSFIADTDIADENDNPIIADPFEPKFSKLTLLGT
jgi:hypothetical protein